MSHVSTSSIRFHGLIAPEEPQNTGDGRVFARNSLSHRRLPVPGMFKRSISQRHEGAVAVARLESVEYVPGRGWVGNGAFLDPKMVPEVAEAVYLIREGVSRPSVDLEPNLTFELVPSPHGPETFLRRVTQGRIMGFTFVPYSAFDQVEIEVLDEEDEAILASAGVTFAVNTSSWRSMRIAARETSFNFRQAINRILEWSGGQASRMNRAFLYRDPRGDPSIRSSYRLPIADIIDGQLTLIPRAVFSAAVFMSGGHGGLEDIPDAEKERIRTVITRIYDVLREQFEDPRIRPPWQRGGRQNRDNAADIIPEGGIEMPTISYTLNTDTGEVVEEPETGNATFQDDDGDGDCGNLETAPGARLNEAARRCAARRGWAMSDGSFPIRPKSMQGAKDLGNAIRAVGRARPNTEARRSAVRRHIIERAGELGLSEEIPDTWNRDGSLSEGDDDSSAMIPNTFQDQDDKNGAPCPEGQVKDIDGNCVDADEREPQEEERGERRTSPRRYDTVSAAGQASPPKDWFADPSLTRATPLTITDDGQVYGHLATWGVCHTGIGNQCVTAPRSTTNYAYFRTGETVCADGSRVPVGKITLGTGHADMSLGYVPAVQHYDDSGAVVAVVNAGEDRFGIWVAGSIVPGVDEEKLAELRRSPLSGDWRRIGGNLELVAALAVNSPGFPVLRASGEEDEEIIEVLTSAGVVTEPGEYDPDLEKARRWQLVEKMVRDQRAKELLEA